MEGGGGGVRAGAGPVVAQCAPAVNLIDVLSGVVSLTPFPVVKLHMECRVARLKVSVSA